MQNFLKLSYWIESLPTPFLPWALNAVLALFGAMIVVGIALYIMARKRKESVYWRDGLAHLAPALFQTGILGLLIVWCVEQQASFFGMRVWFLVLAAWFLVRVALVARRMMKILPAKAKEEAEKARIKKYLP